MILRCPSRVGVMNIGSVIGITPGHRDLLVEDLAKLAAARIADERIEKLATVTWEKKVDRRTLMQGKTLPDGMKESLKNMSLAERLKFPAASPELFEARQASRSALDQRERALLNVRRLPDKNKGWEDLTYPRKKRFRREHGRLRTQAAYASEANKMKRFEGGRESERNIHTDASRPFGAKGIQPSGVSRLTNLGEPGEVSGFPTMFNDINKAEIRAALGGIRHAPKPFRGTLHTDSQAVLLDDKVRREAWGANIGLRKVKAHSENLSNLAVDHAAVKARETRLPVKFKLSDFTPKDADLMPKVKEIPHTGKPVRGTR